MRLAALLALLAGCALAHVELDAAACEAAYGGVYSAPCPWGEAPARLEGVYTPGGYGWTDGCGYRSDLSWLPLELALETETTMIGSAPVGVCAEPGETIRLSRVTR